MKEALEKLRVLVAMNPDQGWNANQCQSCLSTHKLPMNKPSDVPVRFKTRTNSFTLEPKVLLTGPGRWSHLLA
jgi:hypothetical protein